MADKSRQKGQKIPEILDTGEQAALLRQPNARYPTGQRNHLLLCLMLNVGLRLSEATGLRWADIGLNTGKLMVRQGKGNKDRTLWVSTHDTELLRKWRRRQVMVLKSSSDHVFTTLAGKPVLGRYVQQMVKRYAVRAGIQKEIHPHTLRHSFATDLYRETKNIRLTQKALGHSNLATTQIYTHIVDEELEDALKTLRHRRASPDDAGQTKRAEQGWVSTLQDTPSSGLRRACRGLAP